MILHQDTYKKNIGVLLKQARTTNEISQRRVAKLLNNTVTNVSQWECGSHLPGLYKLIRLGNLLGFNIEILIKQRLMKNLKKTEQKEEV